LLAWWALHVLRVFVAERLPVQRLETVGIDGWVLGFTAMAALLSGLFFGLVPALTASGASLHESLKEGGRAGTGGRGARARSAFVIVEVAVALVLLVGAGLLVRSFSRLLAVDPGFDPNRTVTMRMGLPGSRYPEPPQRIQFFRGLFERLDALPGVDSAGGISFLPLTGLGAATGFEIAGRPKPERGHVPVCDVRVIAHDYFKAMGMPLVSGRLFTATDPADARNRVLINASMARQYWPGEDPIGKRITVSWNDAREDEIIGVVGDARHASLETEPRATIYWPYARFPYPGMTLSVKASAAIEPLVGAMVSIIREQDAELAVSEIRTMEEVVALSVAQRRLTMWLLAAFAGAALLLAAVGIYGVIAYSVTQRTQEIGIRMALGAQRRDVLRMVVGHAMTLTGTGIVIGAVAALALSRLMSGLLFATEPADPATFGAVAAVLAGVAAFASYLPGRRATRVDPVVALRAE
jgi:putative ABC transport system permease protein